jgi:hypothetical protein
MGNRARCPGCGDYSSDIWALQNGTSSREGCPTCGLSADAMLEVNSARERYAEAKLAGELEAALLRAVRAEAALAIAERRLEAVRYAVDGSAP